MEKDYLEMKQHVQWLIAWMEKEFKHNTKLIITSTGAELVHESSLLGVMPKEDEERNKDMLEMFRNSKEAGLDWSDFLSMILGGCDGK